MKSNFLSILILLIPFCLFSQEAKDRTVYLDSTYHVVEKGKHDLYRIIKEYNLYKYEYQVEDYYKSGELKQTGTSISNVMISYTGLVTNFYKNGIVEQEIIYKDANEDQAFSSWYEDGKKKIEGAYIIDKSNKNKPHILRIDNFWDENGIHKVIDGNGIHHEKSANFAISGEIKNGLRNGIWNGTDKKYKLSFSDTYENGKFISGLSKDDELVERNYTQINEFPLPKKGIEHFYNFVGRKFNSGRNTLRGNILIGFIIDKNGAIDEVKVLRGMSPKLDREALRVVNLYADWLPGKYRGKLIDISYSLPISVVQM